MNIKELNKTISSLPNHSFFEVYDNIKRYSHHQDFINLSQGNPDSPTPKFIIDSLKKAASNPEFHKYGSHEGLSIFRKSISEFYKREYNVNIDPSTEIAIFDGGKSALYVLSQVILNKDDTALIPNPGYPEYLSGVSIVGANPFYFNLNLENNFFPDFKYLKNNIPLNSKIMYLNYPNNPTGAVSNKEVFNEAVNFAKDKGLYIIHDFAYANFDFKKEKSCSFLSTKGAKDIGVEIYTLSKTFNMAGWRVAFVVGNSSIISQIKRFQSHTTMGLFGAIQYASAKALDSDQSTAKNLKENYKKRVDFFVEYCKKELNWPILEPQGTFYIWLKVPENYTSLEFTELLLSKKHIAVIPGEIFGTNAKDYVRLSMVVSLTVLKEVIERLKNLKKEFFI